MHSLREGCIVLLQVDTLHCQLKELEHKGGQRLVHDVCIMHTAVGEKARLGNSPGKLDTDSLAALLLRLTNCLFYCGRYCGGVDW